MTETALQWQVSAKVVLPLDQPRIIGILNVTPDSFSDGGQYLDIEPALNAAVRMKQEGACIIDVGGESTRPGANAVDDTQQRRRVVPVIERIRALYNRDELLISIDTTRSEVAHAALDAGADIINDISAGRDDDRMLPLAASRHCGLILMHRLAAPRNDSFSDRYQTPPDYDGDVVGAVCNFLRDRCDAAMSLGVNRDAIVIDPGLGFGKSVAQNYELIRRTCDLRSLGFPVLSAASRKSFIGAVTGETVPSQRIMGSVAISVAHYLAGVRLFRVHDVAAHREALAVAQSIVSCR